MDHAYLLDSLLRPLSLFPGACKGSVGSVELGIISPMPINLETLKQTTGSESPQEASVSPSTMGFTLPIICQDEAGLLPSPQAPVTASEKTAG